MSEIASFSIAVLSLLVAIFALILGDKAKQWRWLVGLVFFMLTAFFAYVGFAALANSHTQITTAPIIPSASLEQASATKITEPKTPQAESSEILPRGVKTANEMPDWLSRNVGGNVNQWKRLGNGKWRFRAGNAGGIGENQILSPREGYLHFGADSGKKDSSGGVIWAETTIGPGETTFWRCGEPK